MIAMQRRVASYWSNELGILDIVEAAVGAFGADKALEAVDPNAGILAKGAAAIAGFEGVSKLKEVLGGSGNEQAATDEVDTGDPATADSNQNDDNA
jgi:hypothetical protein